MLKYPVFCIWIIRQRTDQATNDQFLFFFICNADSINTHLFVTQSHGPFPGTFYLPADYFKVKGSITSLFFL